jgi:SAM-dependent methyltransferase
LLCRWLPSHCGRLIKTDLFDEAVGHGLYPELADRADEVVGVDVSGAAVHAAAERYPGFDARVGDVLALPFADASFDVVVSNSTLDHFESRASLCAAVRELARLLRTGGNLIITLDNRANPIVAVRTSRLLGPLHRLGVVPYYVGATCGPRSLSSLLRDSGFNVAEMASIMHCPPQLAAHLAVRLGAAAGDRQSERRYLQRVLRFEAMARWPTRYLTGHFVAARAVRR